MECKRCKKTKEITDFPANKRRKLGRGTVCKECRAEQNRAWYRTPSASERFEARKERKELQQKKYRESAKGRATAIAKFRRDKLKHTEKYKARYKLRNAVWQGKIIKLPCEVCGDKRSQGHHEDYTKALEVKWLCDKHHKALHRAK